jgi:hypothetical protein
MSYSSKSEKQKAEENYILSVMNKVETVVPTTPRGTPSSAISGETKAKPSTPSEATKVKRPTSEPKVLFPADPPQSPPEAGFGGFLAHLTEEERREIMGASYTPSTPVLAIAKSNSRPTSNRKREKGDKVESPPLSPTGREKKDSARHSNKEREKEKERKPKKEVSEMERSIQQGNEKIRLELERCEKEKREKEEAEHERKERREREAKERKEREDAERLQREEKERLEAVQKERDEKERVEKERGEREREERKRKKKEKEEKQRKEKEATERIEREKEELARKEKEDAERKELEEKQKNEKEKKDREERKKKKSEKQRKEREEAEKEKREHETEKEALELKMKHENEKRCEAEEKERLERENASEEVKQRVEKANSERKEEAIEKQPQHEEKAVHVPVAEGVAKPLLSPRGETETEKAARIRSVRELAEKEKAREKAEVERAKAELEQEEKDLMENFDATRAYTPLQIDQIAELILRGVKIALTSLVRECMQDCTPGNLALEKKTAIALGAKELRKFSTMMSTLPSNAREPSQAQALKNAAIGVEKFISTAVAYVQQNASPESMVCFLVVCLCFFRFFFFFFFF